MNINIKDYREKLHKEFREEYGWKYHFVMLWWKIQDLYYETIVYDIVWWIKDGQPQWEDSEKCTRKLCCKCGNKPF